jgi:hypothetical protein
MSADEIISNLEVAKTKLTKAKADGLTVIGSITQARNSVSHAFGRSGSRSPLIAQIAAKEKGLLAKVMAIDSLITKIDAAIQQAREIGSVGGAGSAEPTT